MGLWTELPEPAAAAAPGVDVPATGAAAHAPDTPDQRWVTECCRVQLDAEGNVQTPIPALMAAAVARLVDAAATADAAAGPSCSRGDPTRLHGCRAPGIGVGDYATRMLRYCKNSPVCYVAAFAYMARLQRGSGVRGGRVRVDGLTAHRMMAVGAVVATKFFDDKFFSNHHYAQVAGVSLPEFNAIELDFLFRLDFRARVSPAELAAALREMAALAGPAAAACLPADPAVPPAAAEAEAELESDASADTAGPAAAALAAADEREEARGCAASSARAPLPWAAGTRAPPPHHDPDASTPRRSKRRCSAEAATHPHLPGGRQLLGDDRLAGAVCQA